MTRFFPVSTVLAALLLIWLAAVAPMNWDQAHQVADEAASFWDILLATFALDRPILPAPQQVAGAFVESILDWPITSPRSLVFHAAVTAAAAAVGFAIALAFGLLLAIGIVHIRTLDRALMPWVIASQAIPVLAIAPIVVVVLGNLGLTGLLPKALIAGWLSFFPITMGMVKGLRSPDPMQRDLLRTYNASQWQIFSRLLLPAAMAFLLPSARVAAPLALVGAIVAELPTGAQAGLGARLLAGSYYGQTLMIWSALFMAAFLALAAVAAVDLVQAALIRQRGGRL